MADQRTMAQLLQAPTKAYEDAIVVLAITADNFKLKHGLLTLIQNKQFYGHDKEDPHAHIRATQIWLEKEPPRSICTWDDLVSKFINHEALDRFKDLLRACPHHDFLELHQLDTFYNTLNSKDQDSLNSAAEGNFLDKMLLFLKVGSTTLNDKVIVTLSSLKLDTFYNTLNSKDQDSLNSAAEVQTLQQGQLNNSAVGTLLH
nr:hypothetical protein [Tanacetum cinerariifolium]